MSNQIAQLAQIGVEEVYPDPTESSLLRVGSRVQANTLVAFRYQCECGKIIEIGARPASGHNMGMVTGYLVHFDNPELSNLWLEPKHFF